ncbi:hypothetical protein OTU49_016240, partial [Cherax quadricarinatus]
SSMIQSQADKPPVHLYHPGVASSMSVVLEESVDSSGVAGKKRKNNDVKKVTNKRRKSLGEGENSSGDSVTGNKSAESSPASKMSPTTSRGKKGPVEGTEPEILQVVSLETRSARGKKISLEPSVTTASSTTASTGCSMTTSTTVSMATSTPVSVASSTAVSMATSTAVTMATSTATSLTSTISVTSAAVTVSSTASTTSTSQIPELASPSKTRRAQAESSPPTLVPQVTSSPSRPRRQPSESGETPPRPQLSSPARSRRNLTDLPVNSTDTQPHPPILIDLEAESSCGNPPVAASDNSETYSHKRISSSVHLDTSVESLPSVASLHSPTSESFHSAEDDPTSPRKEKRHRDGSKKKKKDKDKELDGGRKRKKHHHRDKHGLGEMASEMVTPVRIKIKPLPPRPMEENGSGPNLVTLPTPLNPAPVSSHVSTPSISTATVNVSLLRPNYQTMTPPAGYPPLPPGYTLTQPMAPPSSSVVPTSAPSHATATHLSASTTSQAPTSHINTYTTSGSTQHSPGASNRRRSDPSDPQQFSKCDVCGETGGVTNTVSCDECNKAYHFNCLEPPLKKSPKRRGYSWFCEDCDNAT